MLLIYFILGTLFGSFLNVCIYRLPQGISLSHPRSHCPHCKTVLGARDLVPVFSFLVGHGRCRYCQAPISRRYMLVELLCGMAFLLAGFRYGFPLSLPYLLWSCILIVGLFLLHDGNRLPFTLGLLGLTTAVLRWCLMKPDSIMLIVLGMAGGMLFYVGQTKFRNHGDSMLFFLSLGLFYGLVYFSAILTFSILTSIAIRCIMKRICKADETEEYFTLIFMGWGLILMLF